jgi:hypothetical protein
MNGPTCDIFMWFSHMVSHMVGHIVELAHGISLFKN